MISLFKMFSSSSVIRQAAY